MDATNKLSSSPRGVKHNPESADMNESNIPRSPLSVPAMSPTVNPQQSSIQEDLDAGKSHEARGPRNFPDLPTELRLKVWEMARPEARYLILEQSKDGNAIFCSAPVPTLLQVNRESREVAEKWYQLSFPIGQATGRVRFDWEMDGLYCKCNDHDHLSCYNCGHKVASKKDRTEIKRILFQWYLPHGGLRRRLLPPNGSLVRLSKCFPALEKIMVINGNNLTSGAVNLSELREPSEEVLFPWHMQRSRGRKPDDLLRLYQEIPKRERELLFVDLTGKFTAQEITWVEIRERFSQL